MFFAVEMNRIGVTEYLWIYNVIDSNWTHTKAMVTRVLAVILIITMETPYHAPIHRILPHTAMIRKTGL